MATQKLLREEPEFTKLAFSRLLEWLDAGVDSKGETYLEMRRRLVSYFDRRNRPFADDLADDTLSRIARELEKTGRIAITPPARYCYVIARFVLLEDLRRGRRLVPVDLVRTPAPIDAAPMLDGDHPGAIQEQRLECLDRCLESLKPDQHLIAVEYYRDAKRARIDQRRELANRLGITMNALGIRASRIRSALETCLDACCKQPLKRFVASSPIRASRFVQDEHV